MRLICLRLVLFGFFLLSYKTIWTHQKSTKRITTKMATTSMLANCYNNLLTGALLYQNTSSNETISVKPPHSQDEEYPGNTWNSSNLNLIPLLVMKLNRQFSDWTLLMVWVCTNWWYRALKDSINISIQSCKREMLQKFLHTVLSTISLLDVTSLHSIKFCFLSPRNSNA